LPLASRAAVGLAAPAPLGAELHFVVLRLARRLRRLGHQRPHGLPAVVADDFAGRVRRPALSDQGVRAETRILSEGISESVTMTDSGS
jgi:hypothetical protein